MSEEKNDRRRPFAGAKKPSMLRRWADHDYRSRQMYMVTMVTEGRRPLFGRVEGKSEAAAGSADAPRMALSELGRRVKDEWWACSMHHPEIEVVALQMMPDHLHGVLFVREQLDTHLGITLRGFKQSCNKHYRELFGSTAKRERQGQTGEAQAPALATQETEPEERKPGGTGEAQAPALATQETEPEERKAPRKPEERKRRDNSYRQHGLLFAPGYNDKILMREGQLQTWLDYLRDNPRRLLMKREHPDLFRVQRGLVAAGISFSAIGNRFLLERPVRLQVKCSRRLTEAEISERVAFFLDAASQGAVLVSPAISPGEKAVMRAAFDRGFPLVYLQENGLTDLAKPGGKRMEACARGQLLILAPWQHHNERLSISRGQCLQLNEMARRLCETTSIYINNNIIEKK